MENLVHKEVKVSALYQHPLHVRSLEKLADLIPLVVQIANQGIAPDHPVVVTVRGEGGYTVIKGNRRWLAFMLAMAVPKGDYSVENVRAFVSKLVTKKRKVAVCPKCKDTELGNRPQVWCDVCGQWFNNDSTISVSKPFVLEELIMGLYKVLKKKQPDLVIPVVLKEHTSEAEVFLDMIGDNHGSVDPDIKGEVAAIIRAVQELHIPTSKIAQATGRKPIEIDRIVSLSALPQELVAHALNRGWPLTVVARVNDVKDPDALAGVVASLLNESNLTGAMMDRMEERFAVVVPQTEMVLDQAPVDINKQRGVLAVFEKAKAVDPVEAWTLLAGGQEQSLRAMAGLSSQYYAETSEIVDLCPELRCDGCQLEGLLKGLPFDKAKYPCVRGKDVSGCMYAVPEGDPFFVGAANALWDFAKDKRGSTRGFASAKKLANAVEKFYKSADDEALADRDAVEKGGDTPARRQRAAIASYMINHLSCSGAGHMLATRCEDCAHLLEESPVVSNPLVPPCNFTRRPNKSTGFLVRNVYDKENATGDPVLVIPCCGQYKPVRSLADRLPPYPRELTFSREWHERQIRLLIVEIREVISIDSHYGLCKFYAEFIGGRPRSSSKTHSAMFEKVVLDALPGLSNSQLAMLLAWLQMEYEQSRLSRLRDQGIVGGTYLLPMEAGTFKYAKADKFPFPPVHLEEPLDPRIARGEEIPEVEKEEQKEKKKKVKKKKAK